MQALRYRMISPTILWSHQVLIRLNPGVPRGGVTSDQATQPKGERFRYSQVKPSCDPCSGICSFFLICRCLADLLRLNGGRLPCLMNVPRPTSTWFEFVCVCGHCHVDDLRLHMPSTAWHQCFFCYAAPRHGSKVGLFSVGIAPSAFLF